MAELPDYYFRIRENGAAVFRVEAETRHKRLEMTEIAAVNIRNGNVKAHGQHELSAEDEAAIARWMADRTAELAARDAATPEACIEALNLTAHWVQSKATDGDLDACTDRLLLAMHDLRSVLVRKKAGRSGAGD
ncbi:hypothetical protein HKCCE3408_07125 [Rhodobacterales bacterium HKCCE3408]|nr:hypothetical protein [Rhodobacterales bacterium HKCCE3408]